jgi:hypothetical protein
MAAVQRICKINVFGKYFIPVTGPYFIAELIKKLYVNKLRKITADITDSVFILREIRRSIF